MRNFLQGAMTAQSESKETFTMTEKISKRELLKKSAYVAPAILTLSAMPSFASSGSDLFEKKDKEKGNNGVGNGLDPQPPGNPRINDGPGTSPGNPGDKQKNKS